MMVMTTVVGSQSVTRTKQPIRTVVIWLPTCVGGGEAENEAYGGGGIRRQWQKVYSGSSEKLDDEVYVILYRDIEADNSTAIIRSLLPNNPTQESASSTPKTPLQTAPVPEAIQQNNSAIPDN